MTAPFLTLLTNFGRNKKHTKRHEDFFLCPFHEYLYSYEEQACPPKSQNIAKLDAIHFAACYSDFLYSYINQFNTR